MNQDRQIELLNRYLEGKTSAQEDEMIDQWLTESAREDNGWHERSDEEKQLILNDLYQQITQTIKPKAKVVNMRRWVWIAAASLMLISFSVSTYLLIHKKSKTDLPSIAKNEKPIDIAPGGNKAILTLADGTKIILDSANNGAITKQGNITVIKLNDGEIAYNPQLTTHNSQSATADRPITVSYNTISTPRGGQYQLVLADGSKVWLNAESSLRFPTAFAGNERKVQLTGEGYFEVAHNASKPFRVSVNDMTVEVLGTHFNVNAYKDEDAVKTTLLQGSVRVSEGHASVLIKPGEQARVNIITGIKVKKYVNMEQVVAWKNGIFYFDKDNIEEVMRELARWYDVNVSYKGEMPERNFSGEIKRSMTLSQVMKVLEYNNIKYSIIGNQMIISQ